jgi:hypothetical protein
MARVSATRWPEAEVPCQAEGRNLLLELLTAPEEERAALELALLEDDALFEELERAEDELIDAAISGNLEPASRQLLDELLAVSPRLRERLATAYQLRQRALEHQARNRWRRERVWVAAAAGLGIAAVGIALVIAGEPQGPPHTLQADVASIQAMATDRGQAASAASPPLFLALMVPRDSAYVPVLSRPATDEVLPVHAEVGDEPYATFRLTLLDGVERERISWQGLAPEARDGRRVVVVEVPWSQLGLGRALLVLAGEEEEGSATDLAYHELEVARPSER